MDFTLRFKIIINTNEDVPENKILRVKIGNGQTT